ncbi:MAG: UbiD family decarboxylase [Chloroflexota bacterium]|nr:UbiD family decarboxylase [Chloroflexota bacterium]
MAKDLNNYLAFLEKNYPEQVYHVTREVNPEFEATAIIAKLEKENRFPVVIFDNVKGSKIPVIINMHANFQRLAMAIGLPANAGIQDFIAEYGKRETSPIDPVVVSSKEAPVQEVVWSGDEVDLYKLPLLKYHGRDAGHYITLGYEIMQYPESGNYNAGIYRLMRQTKNEMGIQISETAHGHYILKQYRRDKKVLPFAVTIGHHPAINLGFLSWAPGQVDDFKIAGGILGEPLRLVKCKTVPVLVPADAQIVLECEIRPDEFREEAPFGEYPGTYGPQRINPVVHVKAITMRKNPIYQSCFVGHPDNLLLSGLTRCTQILRAARMASPTVTAVNMPLSGRCRFTCYVAMDKLIEGDPKNVAMAVFAADPFLKYVYVVDKDVDVLSDYQVMHAVATRVRADYDTFMVTHARGSPLDPSSYAPEKGYHLVTKMGIDATRKANYPEEIAVPGTDDIKLEDYLGKSKS